MSEEKIALSWSRISNYRQCPRQFEAKYISKIWPDESNNPAFEKGNRIHKQLEEYILFKKGKGAEPVVGREAKTAIPLINDYFEKYEADNIDAEMQLALDFDWNETSWYGPTDIVKFRGIIDMVILEGDTAIVIDWKSGKVRPYEDEKGQLHLTASYIFELYPHVETIEIAYIFVEHKKRIKVDFKRSEHKANKASFDLEYAQINEDEEFAAKKNTYCFFCSIKEDCEYG